MRNKVPVPPPPSNSDGELARLKLDPYFYQNHVQDLGK